MSFYEHTVITRQDLTQNQQNKLLEKYQEIIKKNSGKVVRLEKWGLLNFSHKIKKYRFLFFIIKLCLIFISIKNLSKSQGFSGKFIKKHGYFLSFFTA